MLEFGIVPIPCNIWNWYANCNLSALIPIDDIEIYYMSLERKKASVSRKGILFNGLLYKNENISKLMAGIRNTKNITIAYDTNNIKSVYLLNDGKYIKFSISEDYSHLSTMNSDEYELFKSD